MFLNYSPNIRHSKKKHRRIKIVKDNFEDCVQYAVMLLMKHGCYNILCLQFKGRMQKILNNHYTRADIRFKI